jgi:hypothetical protein
VSGTSALHVHSSTPVCSQTAIYAQGVGLGASKGKEIGKYAEGYTGYVQQAQEAVSAPLLGAAESKKYYRKELVHILTTSFYATDRHGNGTTAEDARSLAILMQYL